MEFRGLRGDVLVGAGSWRPGRTCTREGSIFSQRASRGRATGAKFYIAYPHEV